jgi:hypothetical protein
MGNGNTLPVSGNKFPAELSRPNSQLLVLEFGD